MMLYKRANTWHMDVTVNGVRYRQSLKTSDKRKASALEKSRIAAIETATGQEVTFTLQRYEFGLLIVAISGAVDEAQDVQNTVLMELLLELLRKIQTQARRS